MADSIADTTPVDILDKQQIIGFFNSLPPQQLAQTAVILQRVHPDRLSYLAGASQSEVEAAHRATMDQITYAHQNMAGQAQFSKEALATAQAYHENLRRIPKKVESGLDQVVFLFWVQFATGILFALTAIVLVFMNGATQISETQGLLSVTFGAGGIGTMVWAVATSSPRQLQKSRIDLAQLNLISTSWLNSLMAISAFPQARSQFLAQRQQAVGAGPAADSVDWPVLKEVHELNLSLTERSAQLIEQVCEFGPPKRQGASLRSRSARPEEPVDRAA